MTLLPSTMRGSPNLSSDVLVFLLLSAVAALIGGLRLALVSAVDLAARRTNEAAPQPGLRERAVQRSGAYAVTKVLVVDDEPQIVRALAINLRARGYDVRTAGSGSEALAVAAAHVPELVVLDLGPLLRSRRPVPNGPS